MAQDARKEVRVDYATVEDNRVIYLQKGIDRMGIITLIQESAMYRRGLQNDFKNYADLDDVARHLSGILEQLLWSSLLTEKSYDSLTMLILGKYIESFKTWQQVQQFINPGDESL